MATMSGTGIPQPLSASAPADKAIATEVLRHLAEASLALAELAAVLPEDKTGCCAPTQLLHRIADRALGHVAIATIHLIGWPAAAQVFAESAPEPQPGPQPSQVDESHD
jgi:hypothetical protein